VTTILQEHPQQHAKVLTLLRMTAFVAVVVAACKTMKTVINLYWKQEVSYLAVVVIAASLDLATIDLNSPW
jgi:hypothetical protein